jgi:competence protein ComEA
MEPEPQFHNPGTGALQGQSQYQLSQQQTLPQPIITVPLTPASTNVVPAATQTIKSKLSRIFAVILTLVLAGVIFFIWHSPSVTSTTQGITQQNLSGPSSSANDSSSNSTSGSGDIQVYVVGAVKHPGVYTLPADARLFQLLQAAGGALPSANLVALNLAAKLTDGEEVYVLAIGEIPPTYVGGVPQPGTNGTPSTGTGQLTNINTASADELRTNLHVSSTTAQSIVNYRMQHGPYTSIDQLLQVISKSIYDRIKAMVTI